jgi:uncharacterized membrane protein
MRVALWLHLLSIVVWVGGMFFAHVALRPALQSLPPPLRLPLVASTLATFLGWVAAAVATMIVTGAFMIVALGGLGRTGQHVHLMTALGVVMSAIYAFIVSVPFPRLRRGVAAAAWEEAAAALATVRRLIGVNLVLGLVTITVAILGHDVV